MSVLYKVMRGIPCLAPLLSSPFSSHSTRKLISSFLSPPPHLSPCAWSLGSALLGRHVQRELVCVENMEVVEQLAISMRVRCPFFIIVLFIFLRSLGMCTTNI